MPDWLGYKRVASKDIDFLPFKKARAVVRKLKLRSKKEWREWSKSERPANVPSLPSRTYRGAGWVSMPDWLGYKPKHGGQGAGVEFLPFKKARAIVRKLKLRSKKEWKEWSKSERPANLPGKPHVVYRGAGWVSLPDWLGYVAHKNGHAKHTRLPVAAAPKRRAASKKRKRAAEPPTLPLQAASPSVVRPFVGPKLKRRTKLPPARWGSEVTSSSGGGGVGPGVGGVSSDVASI